MRTASVYDSGQDIGRYKLVFRPVQDGDSEDPSGQGLVLERKLHKTAHKGVAYVFLGLPDLVLMDNYQALAIRYCQSKDLPYELDSTFFITPRGKEVGKVDFSRFCQITGYAEFTAQQARVVFASWVVSQKSQRLSECATFAANHSAAIRQSHYVSIDAKKVQALEALAFYQRTIGAGGEEEELLLPSGDDDDDGGGDVVVNLEYDQALRDDLAAVEDQRWAEALERERQRDEREKVKLDRYVTQNVRFNAVSLIRSLGSDPDFVSACGTDVLEFFLGQRAKCLNLLGRSLLLDMLDWDPSRPEAQVLLANLYLVCSWLDSGTEVNAVEHDWAFKVLKSVYNLSSDLYVDRLPLRLRDLLLELNEGSNWKYYCGNAKVKHILLALKESRAQKTKDRTRKEVKEDSAVAVAVAVAVAGGEGKEEEEPSVPKAKKKKKKKDRTRKVEEDSVADGGGGGEKEPGVAKKKRKSDGPRKSKKSKKD